MELNPTTQRKWSLRSFSLRMLLLLTTLCCIGLGVWRLAVLPYQLQEQAARSIEDLGGKVRMKPSGSTWLAGLFGKEHFNDVVEVNLEKHDDARQYIKHLAMLPELETLRVGHNFRDTEMVKLQTCTRLRRLYFKSSQITDNGLRVFKNFPHLRVLLLGRNITDAGLVYLSDKKSLALVDLSSTQVTDEGLEHLRGLPSLHKVFLTARPISAAGINSLKTLPKLDELYLAGCREISDEAFRELVDLPQLKQLDVSRTGIRQDTIELLQESLTECRILRDRIPPF